MITTLRAVPRQLRSSAGSKLMIEMIKIVQGTHWEETLWPCVDCHNQRQVKESAEIVMNRIKAIGRAYKEGRYGKAMYENPDLADLIQDIGELFSKVE